MRILLAEDEHALGEWLAKALEQSGWRVDWLDDGRLVERTLAQHDYDAVVLDLGLPGRSGYDILRRLPSHPNKDIWQLTPRGWKQSFGSKPAAPQPSG